MKTPRPVDGDVRRLLVEFHRRGDGPAAGQLAELVQAVKHGTVLTHIEPGRRRVSKPRTTHLQTDKFLRQERM